MKKAEANLFSKSEPDSYVSDLETAQQAAYAEAPYWDVAALANKVGAGFEDYELLDRATLRQKKYWHKRAMYEGDVAIAEHLNEEAPLFIDASRSSGLTPRKVLDLDTARLDELDDLSLTRKWQKQSESYRVKDIETALAMAHAEAPFRYNRQALKLARNAMHQTEGSVDYEQQDRHWLLRARLAAKIAGSALDFYYVPQVSRKAPEKLLPVDVKRGKELVAILSKAENSDDSGDIKSHRLHLESYFSQAQSEARERRQRPAIMRSKGVMSEAIGKHPELKSVALGEQGAEIVIKEGPFSKDDVPQLVQEAVLSVGSELFMRGFADSTEADPFRGWSNETLVTGAAQLVERFYGKVSSLKVTSLPVDEALIAGLTKGADKLNIDPADIVRLRFAVGLKSSGRPLTNSYANYLVYVYKDEIGAGLKYKKIRAGLGGDAGAGALELRRAAQRSVAAIRDDAKVVGGGLPTLGKRR